MRLPELGGRAVGGGVQIGDLCVQFCDLGRGDLGAAIVQDSALAAAICATCTVTICPVRSEAATLSVTRATS